MTEQTLAERYAGAALGIDWPAGTPPSAIGRRLILKLNRKYGWYHQPPAVHYKELPALAEAGILAGSGSGLDPRWRRFPTTAEREGCPVVHVYDRNGSYLSIAGSAALPCGTPEWTPGALYAKEAGKSAPAGLWHVQVRYADSPFDGFELPAVCPEGDDLWLWTSTVRCAQECGYWILPGAGRVPGGAILWPEQHKVLGTWAPCLWAARRALEVDEIYWGGMDDDARREAIGLIKRIYAETIGLFGMTPHADEPPTAEEIAAGIDPTDKDLPRWRRPEWQRTIKADQAARIFYYVRKAVERGCPPLWMHADTLAFPSSTDPNITAGSAGLNMTPHQCGAMRHEYSIALSDVLDNPSGCNITVDGKGHKLPGVSMRPEDFFR